jgi:cell division protease FtsH
MDGFTGNEGVIVLAATNRPEILDLALLRPGRFDRRITVNAPDQEGRLRILQVHTRKVPLEDPADLEVIAASTAGMVGADLKDIVNEAALGAARRGEESVSREDWGSALERVTLGAARRIVISDRSGAARPTTNLATRSSGCSSPVPTRFRPDLRPSVGAES